MVAPRNDPVRAVHENHRPRRSSRTATCHLAEASGAGPGSRVGATVNRCSDVPQPGRRLRRSSVRSPTGGPPQGSRRYLRARTKIRSTAPGPGAPPGGGDHRRRGAGGAGARRPAAGGAACCTPRARRRRRGAGRRGTAGSAVRAGSACPWCRWSQAATVVGRAAARSAARVRTSSTAAVR